MTTNYQLIIKQKDQEIIELKQLLNEKTKYIELQDYLLNTINDFKTKYETQIKINQQEFEKNNNFYKEILQENNKLKEDNDILLKTNVQLQQNISYLNNEINELIKLEEEYESFKINQKELIISNNKLINDIHKKEINKINKIFKQLIDENKKLIEENKNLNIQINKINLYKDKLIEISKEILNLDNISNEQNLLETWLNNHSDNELIRKCDIPDIHINNISIITIINQARIYYKYDIIDKMNYGQLKEYLKNNYNK